MEWREIKNILITDSMMLVHNAVITCGIPPFHLSNVGENK